MYKKLIDKKEETTGLKIIGEANLKTGNFFIIEEETDNQKIINLLTEIRELLKKW